MDQAPKDPGAADEHAKTQATGRPTQESPLGLGRRLVRESTQGAREALGFLGRPSRDRRRPPEGATPGTMVVPTTSPEPVIRVMSYADDELEERTLSSVSELPDLLAADRTTWIEVDGLGDRATLEALAETLGILPMAMADIVHVPQRPKAELHDHRLLVITQMAQVTSEGQIGVEQVSLVLGPGWVASFQEQSDDVFDPVRERIRTSAARIRKLGADYLLYALIDAVIDGYFPVVEALGGVVEALEEEVIETASRASLARIHATRRTLLTLHRVQWGQRDAIATLLRDSTLPLGEAVKPYLRDAHDHAFQTLDAIETYREMVVGLMDLQLSSASHRLNEVMKTLTIVATIFIPLTFVTGVYGMNFDHMPELGWRWGYAAFWAGISTLAVVLLFWFRSRGWLGGDDPPDG